MMAAGSAADFTFTLRIPSDTPNGVTFTNIASVSQSAFDPNTENDSSTAGTSPPPPPTADLSVAKSGPPSAGPDTDVVFTLTVLNAGPERRHECDPHGYAPGDDDLRLAVATNLAFASASTFDPNSENDSAAVAVFLSAVDVAVTKSGPGTADAGATVAYTITVSNAGPDIAQDVVVTDGLPPGTTFVSLTQENGPVASCVTPSAGAGGTVTCAFNTLTAGATAQFTLTLNIGSAVSIVNTGVVATGSFDVDASNNNSSGRRR